MPFKFEKSDVWQLALAYTDLIYDIANQLPRSEAYNLKSQIVRAAISVSLNMAEGSTGQTDAEQARFIGLAIRSSLENVACQHLIRRRDLLENSPLLDQAYSQAETLAIPLQAFRKAIASEVNWAREERAEYSTHSPDDVV